MQNIWTDPVWSKVIAAGIIAILGFLLRIFWNKLPFTKKKQRFAAIENTSQVISTTDSIQALMLIDVNPDVLASQFEDTAGFQNLLDQLSNEELITLDENKIPKLTKKGQKLVKKQRKLEEKMHD